MVRGKHLARLAVAATLVLGGIGVVVAPAAAAPATSTQTDAGTPPASAAKVPTSAAVVGKQAAPRVQVDSQHLPKDLPQSKSLGPTTQVKVNADGTLAGNPARYLAASSYFSTFYNYCWHNFTYNYVYNSSASTQYYRVDVYNQGSSRSFYTYANPYSYAYTTPYFYGIEGAYSSYLYVWNGSSYAYTEYKAGNNTCGLAATYSASPYSGYIYLNLKNTGNAYQTDITSELYPYYGYSTYTGGPHNGAPSPGGTVSLLYYVGYGHFELTAEVDGSTLNALRVHN